MREFSRFYDKQEPAVSRLPLSVNAMLNLSIGFIRLCHTAAILSWETKKALFYHAKPRSGNHGGEAWRGKTKLFWSPGTIWPPCDKDEYNVFLHHYISLDRCISLDQDPVLLFFNAGSCLQIK